MKTTQLAVILTLSIINLSYGLQTQYLTAEHPDKWACEQAQGTYLCQAPVNSAEYKEALIMSIATFASEWDSLDNYVEYLSKPKKIKDDAGTEITAEVKYTHRRTINGTEWVDSLQFNSELPGFWVRYLGTVQNRLAILVTYIVSEEFYQQLAPQFERLIASLKPNREFDANSLTKANPNENGPGQVLGKLMNERLTPRNTKTTAKPPLSEPRGNAMASLLLLLLAAGGVYLFIKKKKK